MAFYTIMLNCKYNEVMYPKGGRGYEENIPAQKAPQKEGARFQKENVHCQRQKGSRKKKS